MGWFSWFPRVERCCFCVYNLKLACYIIAIFMMCQSASYLSALIQPYFCKDIYDVSSPVKQALNILRWIFIAIEILVIVSAFLFLIGICMSLPITADIFILCVLVRICFALVYFIIYIVQLQYTGDKCKMNQMPLMDLVIYGFVAGYFMVVVNSYIDDMSD